MNLIEKIKAWFKKKEPAPAPEPPKTTNRLKKTCKGCGKTFSYDPSWDHIPNYCKDCKKKFTAEREEKQRTGAPRKIKRKCKACGNFFTFPNTLEHYPNYCSNCRKKHQAEMKAKYSRGKKVMKLFDMLETAVWDEKQKAALVISFYDYLNSKSDEFLSVADFSRDEIVSGLQDALGRIGMEIPEYLRI